MRTANPTSPTAAEEALDLALVSSALAALITTYGLIAWAGLSSLPAITGIIAADIVVVFLVVPHAIAHWLDRDVDALLTGQTDPLDEITDDN